MSTNRFGEDIEEKSIEEMDDILKEASEDKRRHEKRGRLIIILVVAILALGGLYLGVIRTNYIPRMYVAQQIEKRYGIDINAKNVSYWDRGEGVYSCALMLDNGVLCSTDTTKMGKIIDENYIHIYYASDVVDDFTARLDGVADEYIVVDDIDSMIRWSTGSIEFGAANSYEDYRSLAGDMLHINVYVRNSATDEEIKAIVKVLAEEHVDGMVIRVDDYWYNALADSNLKYSGWIRQVLADMGYAEEDMSIDDARQEAICDFLLYEHGSSYGTVKLAARYISYHDRVYVYNFTGEVIADIDLEEYLEK